MAEEVYTIRCKGCGSSVRYEAKQQKLKCPHCGSEEEIPFSQEGIEEIDLEKALALAQQERAELPAHKVLACRTCGAQIACKEARATCDFCGSEAVSEAALQSQPIRPQGVLPFAVTAEQAHQSFQTWLRSLWFAPSDLLKRARIEDLRGVYLPTWTFDAQVWAQWSAIPGYYRTRTETYFDSATNSHKTRTVTYVEWGPPVFGVHQDFFDDLLVSGLTTLPTRYLEEVGDFATTSDLRAYEPAYFLGWDVALPDKELPQAWKEGYDIIHKRTEEACKRAVPGDTHRDFRMNLRLSGLTTKLVYLPIYILAYRYGDKSYRVVVHGRTGVVGGDRPISWIKVLLLVLAIAAGIGVLYYILR